MLKLENVCKSFKEFSLNNVTLSVEKGAYFMLIGSSGSGKTLLLDIIAGLNNADSGTILVNGTNVNLLPIQKRNVGLVYQNQTLFPHMSVYENIAYPLKCKKVDKKSISNIIHDIAVETEIGHLLLRRIQGLSGGEIQRVTIARALVNKPDVLLLDEPLSMLDVQLKRGVSSLLRKLNQQGQTIVHVTHDYEEALSLANTIGIIEKGTLIQTGTIKEVLQYPKSEFVANFVGIKNFFHGKIKEKTQNLAVFDSNGVIFQVETTSNIDAKGFLVVDANNIVVSHEPISSLSPNTFEGTIAEVFPTRNGVELKIDIGIEIIAQIPTHSFENLPFKTNSTVWITLNPNEIRFSEQ